MKSLLCAVLLAISFHAVAKNELPNLRFLAAGQQSPAADLSALSWLAGHWQGNAFGGLVEEIWAPAVGGSMMGAFKLVVDNQVRFYEIETISEENGTLVFRLKHFNSDLTGWEAKHDSVVFKLVEVAENRVYFDGLTIEKISDNNIIMYVALENGDKVTEGVFAYSRYR